MEKKVEIDGKPRKLRKRGQQRLEALLDATADLLEARQDENISLADISSESGIPLASVYHFFPNRNAAFVMLAERFNRQMADRVEKQIQPAPRKWQDLIAYRQQQGALFLNANPAAQRLFLGAGVSVEVRNTDLNGNAGLAKAYVGLFTHYFEIEPSAFLEDRLATSIAIMDGVWALSYSRHRCITDAFLADSTQASVAYLRSYLPEFLTPRAQAGPAGAD
ncbi:TetR/AcrR family transcriptional regulator [Chachezhania antarctica]|uniref:TetR/AcrR family transcriptional regulator n=1 Tax=Chachezhania antarctica TaxID=2340860 RepID=UPI000EB35F8F|nr:TetR/AcrR family transcriptional regulator [Chachezhania antarctica]|tara:strand:+ start:3689 stop:4351 length:663 start_codon:yes stop_codon:yes gene_type:complete